MYDFKHFDQVLEAVETLSDEAVSAGELEELAYYAGAMAREWKIPVDKLQLQLLLSCRHAGIEAGDAWFDVKLGLTDGLQATETFCRLRAGHPMKQATIS